MRVSDEHAGRRQYGGQHGDDDRRILDPHGRGESHHNQPKQHRREDGWHDEASQKDSARAC